MNAAKAESAPAAKPKSPSICLPNKFVQCGERFGKFSRVVYALLCCFKGQKDKSYISISKIAESLNIAEKTAEKYVLQLEAAQLIVRAKSPGKKTLYMIPGLDCSESYATIPDDFGGVTYVPISFLKNPAVPIAAKELAMCVLSCQNGDGGYFGSYSALMKVAGISSRQRLSKAINEAKTSGCLDIQKHPQFRTNIYRFVLPPRIFKMPTENAKKAAPKPQASTTPVKVELTPVKPEPTPVKPEPTPVKVEPNPCKSGTDTPVKVERGISNKGISNSNNISRCEFSQREGGESALSLFPEKEKSQAAESLAVVKQPKYLGSDRLPEINQSSKNPLWRPFIDIYAEFIFQQTDMEVKLPGPEVSALKRIIKTLVKTVRLHRTEQDFSPLPETEIQTLALRSWKRIFENWHSLDDFLQKMIRLVQIDSNLPNIIQQLKNGKGKTGNSRTSKNQPRTAASEENRRRKLREELSQDWE